jgi:hypothetical protein
MLFLTNLSYTSHHCLLNYQQEVFSSRQSKVWKAAAMLDAAVVVSVEDVEIGATVAVVAGAGAGVEETKTRRRAGLRSPNSAGS